MPRTVIIIRHAEPDVQPDRPPACWPLSADGRTAAAALSRRIPTVAFLASSDEPKAVETLCLAARAEPTTIHVDHRFGEIRRPGDPFDDDHRARRRAWVEGRRDSRHESWETVEEAAHRFQRAIDSLDASVVAVATHGMVLTAWLVAVGKIGRGVPAGAFWESLGFPDMLTVEVE